MFRSDAQTSQACRALLRRVRRENLWTADGPSKAALELLEADGGYLSSGERVLLLVCFAFWNGAGDLKFADVVGTLDAAHLAAVCELVQAAAAGGAAVDAWLTCERGRAKLR